MERLIAILEDIQPEVDYNTCTDLIDGHYLDSLAIISLVAEIEDEFDIKIPDEATEKIVTVADAVKQIKSAI